ncbi:MAG: M20 family metallo-hydrolase [Bacteroidales bacterium]|nr:M20 family metallo-hydrolase [Bacteroidales bacterium]
MPHTDYDIPSLTAEAVDLLSHLIAIPSVSRDEEKVADFIEEFVTSKGLHPQRHGHNIWCQSEAMLPHRPTLLLNAHIDTVRPVSGWQRDPFVPSLEDGALYGLGSNDCGGGLVSLLQAFRLLRDDDSLPWNLVWLASCEEEVSGKGGMESVVPLLPHIDCAIVGEPTGMRPAIAEKGLMVLDVTAHGRSGHAAREEGDNAIYRALPDIEWFRTHRFERVSPLLGPVKMTVTIIQSGTQHNVVPDKCVFTVDVRSNECYSNQEILDEIAKNVSSEVHARSTRLNSSSISPDHPLAKCATAICGQPYGSPTLSDQALMPWPSLKLGPGESARSHTADEFIRVSEIADSIGKYVHIIREAKVEK